MQTHFPLLFVLIHNINRQDSCQRRNHAILDGYGYTRPSIVLQRVRLARILQHPTDPEEESTEEDVL